MKLELNNRLDELSTIWSEFIYKSKFFQSRINFKDNENVNYFGDILKYLYDTSEIIQIIDVSENNFYHNFSNAISFLQAIYIQQDLIEELLYIFACNTNKGILKKDNNYSFNRLIRNELVGHPIRKEVENSKARLLSSTIFSNRQNVSNISYIRYHKDNCFEGELINYSRKDIIDRHRLFLDKYLKEILFSCQKLLKKYKLKLLELLKVSEVASFENLINCIGHTFEFFYQYDILYEPTFIKEIYKRRKEHIRYAVVMDCFYLDLRVCIKEQINAINRYTNIENKILSESKNAYFSQNLAKFCNDKRFNYELSKLVDKDTFSIELLKDICSDCEEVIEEIEFLEENLNNNLEYYCSYRYLTCVLKRI